MWEIELLGWALFEISLRSGLDSHADSKTWTTEVSTLITQNVLWLQTQKVLGKAYQSSLSYMHKCMHTISVLVVCLVPDTDMTEKENTLQTLIRTVISFFWKSLTICYQIRQTKHISKTKSTFVEYTFTPSILSARRHRLNNKFKTWVVEINRDLFERSLPLPWQRSSADTWRGHQLACRRHIWWHQWVQQEPWPHPAPRLSEPPEEIELVSIRHNGQSIGLTPRGEDLTLQPLSLTPSHGTSDLVEGRDRGIHTGESGDTMCIRCNCNYTDEHWMYRKIKDIHSR